ncbi:MAG: hypothetical protein AAF447_02825 [Myxococcota bacterium]
MTFRVPRIPFLLMATALGLGCGDAGAAQILDATWFPNCDEVTVSCSPTGRGNVANGVAGSEVTGFCDIRDFGDQRLFNFSARANMGGTGTLQIENLRFLSDGFSVVGDDCNVSFVEDGVAYGTGNVSNTSGRCGPAAPSELQPCQVVVDFVEQGESGLPERTLYSGQVADLGPEVRLSVRCIDVGNPGSPNSLRRSLGLALGSERQPALLRGANCTEITP